MTTRVADIAFGSTDLPRDVFCLVDVDGRARYVSRAMERTFGVGIDDVLGHVVFGPAATEDRAAFDEMWRRIVAEPEAEVRAEFRIAEGGGAGRWVRAVAVNLLEDEAVGAVLVHFRDVTAEREAARALESNAALLRAVVDNTTDGLVLIDGDGGVGWCNPAAEQLLGYRLDDVRGRHVLDFVHPDDLDRAAAPLQRVLAGTTRAEPVTVRVLQASGEYRWLEALTNRVEEGPEGAVLMFSLRDVTERLAAETALRRNEERLRAFLEHSKDLTGLVDLDGTIRWISSNVSAMLGYDADEIAGQPAFDYLEPEDLSSAAARFDALVHGDESGAPLMINARAKDGTSVPVEGVGTLLRGSDGGIEGIVVNVRDIRWRLEAEAAMRRQDEWHRALVQHSSDAVIVIDGGGTISYSSPTARTVLDWEPEDVVGRSGFEFIHPDDAGWVAAALADVVAVPGGRTTREFRAMHRTAGWRWVEATAVNMLDNDVVEGVVVNIRDVTERKQAEQARQRLTNIFELTDDLVCITDPALRVVYLNDAARTFAGIAPDDRVEGLDAVTVLPSVDIQRARDDVVLALGERERWRGELEVRRHDGRIVPMSAQLLVHRDADGAIELLSAVLRDMSERKLFEQQLEHQATHDPLTGLPNRSLLLDRLELALARSSRRTTDVAVLFCDLDHFKNVNDSLGHSAGDRLLVAIAERLAGLLRPGDTVSRFGGDEFVVLCEDLDHPDDAVLIAKRVEQAVNHGFLLDGEEVYVGVSVGIAIAHQGAGDPEALIRDADAAMYRAKAAGRSRYQLFEVDMWEQAVDRFDLENALRRALGRGELEVHYQPVVELGSGAVVGVEALLRWNHPTRGMLAPAEFIAVAEETGVIVPVGNWVLVEACRHLRAWDVIAPDLVMSVNLSGRQLAHADLVDRLGQVLAETGADPSRVHLEITESVLMDDVEHTHETLRRLKALGVRLVVDDFGTGYSSLRYLRRFPVDALKVDRSFVDGLGVEPEDTAIVAAVVNLAQTLGLASIAEGVETAVQRDALVDLGCAVGQGFLLARPMPAAAVPAWLSEHRGRAPATSRRRR